MKLLEMSPESLVALGSVILYCQLPNKCIETYELESENLYYYNTDTEDWELWSSDENSPLTSLKKFIKFIENKYDVKPKFYIEVDDEDGD